MQRHLWGHLIAAQLSAPLFAGCSPPPPASSPGAPASVAPAPAESAPAPPEVDPTAGPPGLGAWAPLTAAGSDVVHSPRIWRVAATDKGVLGLVRSRVGEHGCAWNGASDEECTAFFFAPWKDGKGSPARYPVGAVGAWSPVKVSRNWSWIWSGKQGAYTLSTQEKGQTIAVLDGQQERTFQLAGSTKIEQIVETADGPVAFWVNTPSKQAPLRQLVSAPLTLANGKATLGKPTRHAVTLAETAQDARDLLKDKKAPAVEWAAMPNVNDSGGLDKAFLLTWSEAIPPEKNSERASPAQRRIVSMRGMRCGFSPSRPVNDASVVKRIMVQRTTRDGTTQGPAREIARGEAGKDAPLLRLESRPKVRERLVPDSEQVELPAALKSAPEQEILAAGYAPERREGVVVLAQAGELVAQTIDPLGKPTGAPSRLGATRAVERRAVFFTDGWCVPVKQGKALLTLTGPRSGAEVPLELDGPVASWELVGARAVPMGSSLVLIGVANGDPGNIENHSAWVRAEVTAQSKSAAYTPLAEASTTQLAGALALDDKMIALFDRDLPDLDPTVPHLRLSAGRTLLPVGEEGDIKADRFDGESVLVEVFKDLVMVHRPEPEQPLQGVWLRSGQVVPFKGTEQKKLDDFVLSTGGTLALPATPGPAASIAAAKETPRHCVDELAVGPKTRLLLCDKPFGARGWVATAGVQVLRQ